MPLQTSDKNVAHKDTHAQLAALMIPLDEVKVTTHHTTPHHANTPSPSYQVLTSRIRTAGPSMHYTPKVPKNNCQFQNKSMLSWETALVSALTSRRLRLAVQVAEARRVASSALLQSAPSTGAMRPTRQGTNFPEHTPPEWFVYNAYCNCQWHD